MKDARALEGDEMTELNQEQEEVVALSNELSAVAAGHRNDIVFRATINLLATAIVNACDMLSEAETASEQTGEAIASAVRNYWRTSHPH